MPKDDDFDRNVFVNCPFDEDYDRILQAVLFCLVRFGLKPRIASERSDADEPRISKILELIQSSRYSIHDLCRCQAREEGEYYRLNMPFELGLDLGCRHYGGGRLKEKVILVLEEKRYRYQAAISDLAGSDVEAQTAGIRTRSERFAIGSLACRNSRPSVRQECWTITSNAKNGISNGNVALDPRKMTSGIIPPPNS